MIIMFMIIMITIIIIKKTKIVESSDYDEFACEM